MAKAWTTYEVAQVLMDGTDKSKIMDIGARFPILAVLMQKALDNGGKDLLSLLEYLPDDVSANKVNGRAKDGVERFVEEADEKVKEDKPKSNRGRKPKNKPKETLVEAEFEEDSEDVDYNAMSAVELFKECKKRGIAVKPKLSEKAYIKELKAWDVVNASPKGAEEEEVEEDWDDFEEEEQPKPKSKPKGRPKGKTKPKVEEVEEEDEDDWDI